MSELIILLLYLIGWTVQGHFVVTYDLFHKQLVISPK